MPRFVVFVRATPDSEGFSKPDPSALVAMGEYNSSLREAGILMECEGLSTSLHSQRITITSELPPKVDVGPFPPNEIVSGWWIFKTKDMQEAVEWAKKSPIAGHPGNRVVLEVRRIAEVQDFDGSLNEDTRGTEVK